MIQSNGVSRPWPENLDDLAIRLGSNKTLTQGPGGNVSFKDSENMWVKASGTHMSKAASEEIFVGINLVESNNFLKKGEVNFKTVYAPKSYMVPSIETVMHLIIPRSYVAHVHSNESVSASLLIDPRKALEYINSQFKVEYVPYVKPGLNLGMEISRRIGSDSDAILLGNHGLTVWGESPEECLSKIGTIEKLFGEFHRLNSKNIVKSTLLPLEILRGGLLVPDEIVFFGPDANHHFLLNQASHKVVFDLNLNTEEWRQDLIDSLISASNNFEGIQQVRYMTSEEIAEISNWDAEELRKLISKK